MLLLNEAGGCALLDGSLDLLDRHGEYLARQMERPALMYRPVRTNGRRRNAEVATTN